MNRLTTACNVDCRVGSVIHVKLLLVIGGQALVLEADIWMIYQTVYSRADMAVVVLYDTDVFFLLLYFIV